MISASAVTKRHELIMSLVAGLSLINKVWSRTVSPRVSKSHLRRVSSSCPSEGAWDKGAVRRNPIMTRCEDQPCCWIMQGVEASGHEPVRKHWFQPLGFPVHL